LGEPIVSARPGANGGHDIETTLDGSRLYLQATRSTSREDMLALAGLLGQHRSRPAKGCITA